ANSLVIAVSQSGETFDVLEALRKAKQAKAKILAMNNVAKSTMQRMADYRLLLHAGSEMSVLSTKSVIAQIGLLYLVSIRYAQVYAKEEPSRLAQYREDYLRLSTVIDRLLRTSLTHIQKIAYTFCRIKHWFFIGKGVQYPVALESALKFKEVSYRHAEGMSAGFLKHGTISMIDSDFFTLVFLPNRSTDEELFYATLDNVYEIKARGGNVLGIGSENLEEGVKALFLDYIPYQPTNKWLDVVSQLIIGQLLAYYCALALGRNIDKPRALAKSVTVR
ncbi:MAG: SIS domain-containing protein, partial [Gammaproteobacteria bacterium]|nr:SIS domain-containing protein [Gammaproteobacteria bacterium]